jgi:ribosomal protein S18 acetylase RimI-like enzyme
MKPIVRQFGDKKITIRTLVAGDIKKAKNFIVFMNSLIDEDAKIRTNKKINLAEEKQFIKSTLLGIKNKSVIYLIGECGGEVISTSRVQLAGGRKNHIGVLGIMIKNGYRGLGIGTYLMGQMVELAKKELKASMLELTVYQGNNLAMKLYKKMGFKQVARLPKYVQYKGRLIDEYIMIKKL